MSSRNKLGANLLSASAVDIHQDMNRHASLPRLSTDAASSMPQYPKQLNTQQSISSFGAKSSFVKVSRNSPRVATLPDLDDKSATPLAKRSGSRWFGQKSGGGMLSTGLTIKKKLDPQTHRPSLQDFHDGGNKHFFGIKGYIIPKAQHLDAKDLNNPNWAEQMKTVQV